MMDLIDLALKYKDFEWVKELVKERESMEPLDRPAGVDANRDMFAEETVALEDLFNSYAVKEKGGLRAFNINSEFDRNYSELVLIEKPAYRKGETVRFRVPRNEELVFIRGTFYGYLMGYGEAYNVLNRQLSQYYDAVASQASHAKSASAANSRKGAKAQKRQGKTV